jgi:hypothetical protein
MGRLEKLAISTGVCVQNSSYTRSEKKTDSANNPYPYPYQVWRRMNQIPWLQTPPMHDSDSRIKSRFVGCSERYAFAAARPYRPGRADELRRLS